MKAFAYQAALLCFACGEKVKAKLDQTMPDDLIERDSDKYPQGPLRDGGGEADCPQHCDHCGVFLENPLTDDGVLYVNTKAIPYMEEKELAWSEIADRAETDKQPVLAEWIRYYFAWGM